MKVRVVAKVPEGIKERDEIKAIQQTLTNANPHLEFVWGGAFGGYTVIEQSALSVGDSEISIGDYKLAGFPAELVFDGETGRQITLDDCAEGWHMRCYAYHNPEDFITLKSPDLTYYVLSTAIARYKDDSYPPLMGDYGFKYIRGSREKCDCGEPGLFYYKWEVYLTEAKFNEMLETELLNYYFCGESGGIYDEGVGLLPSLHFEGTDQDFMISCYPADFPQAIAQARNEGKIVDYDFEHLEKLEEKIKGLPGARF